jgi:hypothetical protein
MAPLQNVVFGLLHGAVDCGLPEQGFPTKHDVAKPTFQSQLHRLFRGLPEDTSKVTYLILAI